MILAAALLPRAAEALELVFRRDGKGTKHAMAEPDAFIRIIEEE